MTEPITIGVDHGYAAMKTAHCSFPSGLAEYEHEPYTQKTSSAMTENTTLSAADGSRSRRIRQRMRITIC